MNRTDRHVTTRSDRPNEDRPNADRPKSDRSMGNVSHTHPYADRGALDNVWERGPVVAADGGERNAGRPPEDEENENDEYRTDAEATPMRDVDHTAPHGEGESVDRVFERGGKEEPVENEE